MNPASSFMRSCAHQCCRAQAIPRALLSRQQPSRLISTTTRYLYAQPADLPLSPPPFEPSTSSLTVEPLPESDTSPTRPKSKSSKHPKRAPEQQPPEVIRTGTITRTSTMARTVQITTQTQLFDSFLHKHYTRPQRLLAHDPHPPGILREGDVVQYGPAKRDKKGPRLNKDEKEYIDRMRGKGASQKKRGKVWAVRRVVTPFGVGMQKRWREVKEAADTHGSDSSAMQASSSEGGQDSILRGMGGNTSRASARASVAG